MSVKPPEGPSETPSSGKPQGPDIQQLANQLRNTIQDFIGCISPSHDNREGLSQLGGSVEKLGQLSQQALEVK